MPAEPQYVRLLRRYLEHVMVLVDSTVSEADAMLVLSELATNAVQHSDGESVEVVLELAVDRVGIEVLDGGGGPPRSRSDTGLRVDGHGLQIVAALSDGWGWRPNGRGKAVWAEITASP